MKIKTCKISLRVFSLFMLSMILHLQVWLDFLCAYMIKYGSEFRIDNKIGVNRFEWMTVYLENFFRDHWKCHVGFKWGRFGIMHTSFFWYNYYNDLFHIKCPNIWLYYYCLFVIDSISWRKLSVFSSYTLKLLQIGTYFNLTISCPMYSRYW